MLHRSTQLPDPHGQRLAVQTSHKRLAPHLLEVCRRQCLDHTCALAEPRFENSISILKHAILQTNNDELRCFESRLDQTANVLRVRKIQGGVYFVEDVHGCGLELEQCHDQGESDERSANPQLAHSSLERQ